MKNIKLLLLLFAVLILGVACNKMTEDDVDGEGNEFSYVDNGGIFVDNKGHAIPKSQTEGMKIVRWYTEPLCPYCLNLEDATKDYIMDVQGDNTLIKYIPLSFLGGRGIEGEVTYSDVISSMVLSIAENDPEVVGKFMHTVLTNEFVEAIQQEADQDGYIRQAYTDAGGTKLSEVEEDLPVFMEVVERSTNYTRTDKALAKRTPNGKLTTPMIWVEGEEKTIDVSLDQDFRPLFEEKLK